MNSQIDSVCEYEEEKGDAERYLEFEGIKTAVQIFYFEEINIKMFERLISMFNIDPDTANFTILGNACQILASLFDSDVTMQQAFRMLFFEERSIDLLLLHLGSNSVCSLLRNSILGLKNTRDPDEELDTNVYQYQLFIYQKLCLIMVESEENSSVESAGIILRHLINDREDILNANKLIRYSVLNENFFSQMIATSSNRVTSAY